MSGFIDLMNNGLAEYNAIISSGLCGRERNFLSEVYYNSAQLCYFDDCQKILDAVSAKMLPNASYALSKCGLVAYIL